jgi:hypothetical protein
MYKGFSHVSNNSTLDRVPGSAPQRIIPHRALPQCRAGVGAPALFNTPEAPRRGNSQMGAHQSGGLGRSDHSPYDLRERNRNCLISNLQYLEAPFMVLS